MNTVEAGANKKPKVFNLKLALSKIDSFLFLLISVF